MRKKIYEAVTEKQELNTSTCFEISITTGTNIIHYSIEGNAQTQL